MPPKWGMWVRFIRALRLAGYSKRLALGKLRETLDVFYNQTYEVWQGASTTSGCGRRRSRHWRC